jgi:T5orf172 domain
VQARAANIRAGYVYVISNVGAFGERMVKIGLTRRLDPLDRVYELGDASVPFRFDVHAIVFSDDAVGLEARLHQALTDVRVNLVNLRREFFYATPDEVRALLAEHAGHLLDFVAEPEAPEWRQSEGERHRQHLTARSSDVAAEQFTVPVPRS